MSSQRKLKGLLINPSFQLRFIALTACLSVALCFVFLIAVEIFFRQFDELGRSANLPPDHLFFAFLAKQQASMEGLMAGVFGVVLVAGIIFGLWFSHRIAGPAYRLKIFLWMIRDQKKLSTIRFREADFFQEIPEAFNEMVEALEQNGSTSLKDESTSRE